MGVHAKESRGRPQSPLVAANKTSWGEVTNSITPRKITNQQHGRAREGVQKATADFVRFHCPLEAARETLYAEVTNTIARKGVQRVEDPLAGQGQRP